MWKPTREGKRDNRNKVLAEADDELGIGVEKTEMRAEMSSRVMGNLRPRGRWWHH